MEPVADSSVKDGDEFRMNVVPFRALFLANFGEFLFYEVGE
jgi:hypothetical protein